MLLHRLDELVEQVRGIVRSGPSFGVILDRIDRQARVPETFDSVVIQIDMRDLAIGRERISIHREAVILRGDFDAPRGQVLHGLIASVMPKGQFVSSGAERKPHQLMAKTDSKNRISHN